MFYDTWRAISIFKLRNRLIDYTQLPPLDNECALVSYYRCVISTIALLFPEDFNSQRTEIQTFIITIQKTKDMNCTGVLSFMLQTRISIFFNNREGFVGMRYFLFLFFSIVVIRFPI